MEISQVQFLSSYEKWKKQQKLVFDLSTMIQVEWKEHTLLGTGVSMDI